MSDRDEAGKPSVATRRIRLTAETVRSAVTDPYRPRRLERALREIQRVAPDRLPDRRLLEAAREAWGNSKWSAEPDYLVEVVDHARSASGVIVECGSGLSTLLIAIYAQANAPVWALEDNRYFLKRVRRALARQGLLNVQIVHTPLRSYGEYDWYLVPASLPDDIGLVVCDGPPGSGRGGRYGAMPLLTERLRPGFVFLLDDVGVESAAVAQWEAEFGTVTERRPGVRSEYAVIRAL